MPFWWKPRVYELHAHISTWMHVDSSHLLKNVLLQYQLIKCNSLCKLAMNSVAYRIIWVSFVQFCFCFPTEMGLEKTLLNVFLWQLTRYTSSCLLSINVVIKTYRMLILFIEKVGWGSDASSLGEVPSWHHSQAEVLCVCQDSTLNYAFTIAYHIFSN